MAISIKPKTIMRHAQNKRQMGKRVVFETTGYISWKLYLYYQKLQNPPGNKKGPGDLIFRGRDVVQKIDHDTTETWGARIESSGSGHCYSFSDRDSYMESGGVHTDIE
jgi:hypothetical protein